MKLNRLPVLAVALLTSALFLGLPPLAQEGDALVEADRLLLTEIAENSEQMENLRYLTDRIGPRLTGTEKLKRANEWTAERFRAYGLANVHLEPWTIAHSWRRGTVDARVVAPSTLPLTAEAAGWSPDTPGPVRGRLVPVRARTKEELEAYRGKLRGAIVLTPRAREAERKSPLHPRAPRPRRTILELLKFRGESYAFFREEGVAAILRNSSKNFGLHTMSTASLDYHPGLVPTAYLAPESRNLLWRLLEKEKDIEVEVSIEGCAYSDGPVEVYNTVAEIPGREKPDEVVILGAHLDSWDLGTGATDNGTGVSVVLEAARALQKLGLKPKRTIRFILFSGEEQGLHGSRAYVKAHQDELDKISAVLIHDAGTGRVETIMLNGNTQAYEVVNQALQPLRQMIGLEDFKLVKFNASDHAPFQWAGVPGFFCSQERATYRQTHHSQADTFDKVQREGIVNGAQVLAVFAYNIAELDDLLPRPAPSSSPGDPFRALN
ncbi:MAG: M20/M25/M40 family metallo-hydrolase [Terriglobia bacterium]